MEQQDKELMVSYGVDKDMSASDVSIAQEAYDIESTGEAPKTSEASEIEVSLGVEAGPIKEVSLGAEPQTPKDALPQNPIARVNYLKEKNLTHTPEYKVAMIELEKMLGINEVNPFGTNELYIFEDRLKEMTTADMQKLAGRVGINAFLERPHLKELLIREFMSANKNNRRNILPSPARTMQIDPKHPDYAKIQKILGEK